MYNERFVTEENNEVLNKLKGLGEAYILKEIKNEYLKCLTAEMYDADNMAMLTLDAVVIHDVGEKQLNQNFLFYNNGLQHTYYRLLKKVEESEDTPFYSDCFDYIFEIYEGADLKEEESIVLLRAKEIARKHYATIKAKAI